jgi:hypothetical protein
MRRRGGYAGHLVRRFFETLSPAPPDPEREAWARSWLTPGELELWGQMRAADRRHAIGVAEETERLLGDGATEGCDRAAGAPRPVLAAALLHDVGKVSDDLGAPSRAVATVVGRMVGLERARSWSAGDGSLGKLGRYLDHPAIGAGLLESAGSDSLTVQWAADHHLAPEHWRVPRRYASVLKEADDD